MKKQTTNSIENQPVLPNGGQKLDPFAAPKIKKDNIVLDNSKK